MNLDIILEGTDGVGKSSTVEMLSKDGIVCADRSRDVISRYMLFDVDMETRASKYEEYLRDNNVLVIFMVNRDKEEILRRICSRSKISEFDKKANEYNALYEETYRYMAEQNLTHGKLLLADCTGLSFDEQLDTVKRLILQYNK